MSIRDAHTGARVEAQAKLNLVLRVHARDDSGYHQIETLFQRISLADSVAVRIGTAGRTLDCRGADVGPVERNLAWRAGLAFAESAGWPSGFSIEIDKRIPAGAGLGGGSADAAAVLRALNALAPRPLDEEQLAGLAFALGADVPYLVSDASLALATGRGERLIFLDPLPPRRVLLLVPRSAVSSRDAFGWFDTMHGRPAERDATMLLRTPLSWRLVAAYARNDLEAPVFAKLPALAGLREAIAASGALIARMTGSGSVVFGVFDDMGSAAASASVPVSVAAARAIEAMTVERVAPVDLF